MPSLPTSEVSIRPFNLQRDATWLHGLWHRALHPRWALPLEAILATLSATQLTFVAGRNSQPCGLCAVDTSPQNAGLTLLLVEPASQRTGVGTHLLHHAERKLRTLGITSLTLGAGPGEYFWPGVPQEQAAALPFFRHHAFVEDEPAEDLIQPLESFTPPTWVAARLRTARVTLQLAQPAQHRSIAAFERLHFPDWAAHFEAEMTHGSFENIVVALSGAGDILGTIIINQAPAIPWSAIAAMKIGTLNTLGVAPQTQGQGIGLALTAAAMTHLQQRGCTHCFIQWTGLRLWYEKLGVTPWACYTMAAKTL